MNQILKDTVYGKGTTKQIEFLSEMGGMNEEEKEILYDIHYGRSDIWIQEEHNLSRKSYERIEESIRAKILLAVFFCINKAMEG